jgi:queuine tRNA-ribosyltransferase
MFNFTITHKEETTKARTGIIKTANGELKTPAFIPVGTQAAIKALSSLQIKEIGFEALLANTYHLHLRPGSKTVQKLGGLHKFMSFQGPIFTDSGGFQVFSLNNGLCTVDDEGVDFKSYIDSSKHRFTPEISMQIQHELGADIIFTFDECIHFDTNKEKTKAAMHRTHEWAKRSIAEWEKLSSKSALYGIVQGGQFEDLRKESAAFIKELDFPGFGIGGIFGDPKKESQHIVAHTLEYLPYEKPKHMLGIGSVDDLFYYVELGADTFDCVLPTRLARHGYVFIRPKRGGNIENRFRFHLNSKFKEDTQPLDPSCECQVCKTYTRAYIYHLYKAEELLFYSLVTYHNLFFFQRLMQEMREAIENNTFLEMKRKWLS